MSSFGPIQVGNNYFLTGLVPNLLNGPDLLGSSALATTACHLSFLRAGIGELQGMQQQTSNYFPFEKHRRMHSVLKSQAQQCNTTNPNHLSFQPPVMHLAVVLCGLPQGLLSALAFQKLLTTALCLRACVVKLSDIRSSTVCSSNP